LLPQDQTPRPRRAPTENNTPKALGALQVDEKNLLGHVHEEVRSSVEETTLDALLDEEADEIGGAQRYERSPQRVDTVRGLRGKAGGQAGL
jgi:hypothetical protein